MLKRTECGGEPVGRVVQVSRYPVKSMGGESLASAEIDWQGMEGDRQYAFVRRGNTSRFPWLTGREASGLLLHHAAYVDPARPRTSPVRVTDADGAEMDLLDPRLSASLARAATMEIDLMQLGIGAYDSMPLSIVTTAALGDLEGRHGDPLDRRRFRANVVIESNASERDWAGCRLRFGREDGAEILMTYLAPRCSMVTIDPDTGRRDPRVMRTVAEHFEGAFAMYASVARPGMLRVGDPVSVIPN